MSLTFSDAAEERITSVSRGAAANGIVVDDLAVCVLATSAWTGVLALLIDARRVLSAVRAHHAFRSTLRWAARVIWLTGAHCVVVDHATVAVRTAG